MELLLHQDKEKEKKQAESLRKTVFRELRCCEEHRKVPPHQPEVLATQAKLRSTLTKHFIDHSFKSFYFSFDSVPFMPVSVI